MDTMSEVSIRITEAYLSRVNLDVVLRGQDRPSHEEQGQKLGELYAAVYKAVATQDQA